MPRSARKGHRGLRSPVRALDESFRRGEASGVHSRCYVRAGRRQVRVGMGSGGGGRRRAATLPDLVLLTLMFPVPDPVVSDLIVSPCRFPPRLHGWKHQVTEFKAMQEPAISDKRRATPLALRVLAGRREHWGPTEPERELLPPGVGGDEQHLADWAIETLARLIVPDEYHRDPSAGEVRRSARTSSSSHESPVHAHHPSVIFSASHHRPVEPEAAV